MIMKKKIYISASLDQPELLRDMVEKLACKRSDFLSSPTGFGDWQMLDTSGIEKYVSGTVDFSVGKKEQIKMPFVTCFLFSCISEKNQPYKLNWSMSLLLNCL